MKVSHRHHLCLWAAAAAAAALAPGLALAVPSMTSADVTLVDPVNGTFGPQAVAAGSSINAGDGSTIGSVLLSGPPDESIGVGLTSLVYNVQGGLLPCSIAGWSCTGYGAGADYTFDLSFTDAGDFVQSISVVLNNAVYAAGSGVSLDSTGTIVTMDVGDGDLGVINNSDGSLDFGSVEVDLTIGNNGNNGGNGGGTSVPEPASGALLGIGLALAGMFRRRRRR